MLFENRPGCFIIAEVAQGHDGSLGTAHAYIDAIAKTGADAVKFQTHIADAESTPGEPWRIRFSAQDDSRYAYWKRMEFTADQWAGLARHAAQSGLIFLSSAFSLEAVSLLEQIGMAAWKVGAGELTNLWMIERMARTGKPVLLSTGLASWEDLDAAVAAVQAVGRSYAVFQCTTAYPCPPEKLGLNVISEIRQRYGCPVGLSDHSGTIYAGLAAAAIGIQMLEVHTVFSRECFGPDTVASITTAELAQLVKGVRFIERALAHPVDKQLAARDLWELRTVFGKSIFAVRDLPAGKYLQEDDLALKKPGDGIPAARFAGVLNCRLKRAVPANTALSEEDIEQRAS